MTIEHAPLAFLDTEKFPFVEAEVNATTRIERARVYFKAHDEAEWYLVAMDLSESSAYQAALPTPLPVVSLDDMDSER